MAKKNNKQQINDVKVNSFVKGLNKDADPLFVQEGMWTHARNVVNNTVKGNLGGLSNEESNALCSRVGDTMGVAGPIYIIGAIYLYDDKWVIYSVGYDALDQNPQNSEIGLFESNQCKYRPIVQDTCLAFNKLNLITGASRLGDDCAWSVYWADGLNPDRYLKIGDPQTWPDSTYSWLGGGAGSATVNYYSNGTDTTFLWPGVEWVQIPDPNNTDPNCNIVIDDHVLDCDAIRIASFVKTPCLDINISEQSGVIENGSYALVACYVIDRQRVTNYFSPTYIQPVFNEPNERGSFEITVDADVENFEEFELVAIRFINENASAKRIGYYSTSTTKITVSQISEQNVTVAIEDIVLQNPVFERSQQISEVNDTLLRIGPTSKFDFNYQPLANLIQAEWVSIEYPEKYYVNGGKNAGYLRDEVYSFFIRWIYDTGDKSASYHIPGRPAEVQAAYGGILDTAPYVGNPGGAINKLHGESLLYESVNTATVTSSPNTTLPDGGKIIAAGKMGYWQSSEKYPDNEPSIWNSSSQCWTKSTDPNYDLCGKFIRHHKFPDNALSPATHHFVKKSNGEFYIRLMGVQFKNIILPKDNDGNDIPNIVGYEILRGSRHGNKSVLAKGMVNNFRDYKIKGSASGSAVGLYANHPFNTIIPKGNSFGSSTAANYTYNDTFIADQTSKGKFRAQSIPLDIISFHSPDTSFINPYLSTSELKIYGSVQGVAEERFIEPDKHPQFKLVADFVVIIAAINGIVDMLLKGSPEIKVNYPEISYTQPFQLGEIGGGSLAGGSGAWYNNTTVGQPMDNPSRGALAGAAGVQNGAILGYINGGGTLADVFTGGATLDTLLTPTSTTALASSQFKSQTIEKTLTGASILPTPIQVIANTLGLLSTYFIQGMNDAVDILYAIIRKRQYALQLVAHGDYNKFVNPDSTKDSRFFMQDGIYVKDQIQDYPEYITSGTNYRYRINNLKRGKLAVLRTTRGDAAKSLGGPHYLLSGSTAGIDTSMMTVGVANATGNLSGFDNDKKDDLFTNPIASHYVGIKYNIKNQYGQLDSVQQIVASPCEQKLDFMSTTGENAVAETDYGADCGLTSFKIKKTSTPAFFGGDTYVNRFTEKNVMPFFYNWLHNVPDNIEFNYFLNQMIPTPRFGANSQPWDVSDFNMTNAISALKSSNTTISGNGLLPTSYYNLDNKNYDRTTNKTGNYPGSFYPKDSYFYIASCGIRDFFVESEVLVDFREEGTFDWQHPYSKYKRTDLEALFNANPEILAKGNYYGYDYSLSASRFIFNQYFSAGYLQARDYDPEVAELCYSFYPNRIMYSLPKEWLLYLPDNKQDFKSKINSVKNFARTGMFITFTNDSPLIYQGVEQLQLDSGTSVTIGDGALFSQGPQNVVVAEKAYEYGSAQSKYGVISTPAGMYYISQNQGKVFAYQGGLKEISQNGMKWWFTEFLPFKLLKSFPDYPHTDNPVAGISCTGGFDNDNGVLYFSKRDFKLRDQYEGLTTYNSSDDTFYIDNGTSAPYKAKLGNPLYFEDASWTVSYDPKSEFWISFHDWHPTFIMPNRNVFHTIKGNGIWKHSANCNDYCNYYGVQYPFEIEFPILNVQNVSTLKGIEYYLECYRRDQYSCVDAFHVLDYNFDKLVVYNTEQVSGYLNLNLYPKNDIALSLTFPKLAVNAYDVLYSKEENKYRVNQFWDITKDRGEFPLGSTYPPGQGPYIPGTTILNGTYPETNIWITESNGYKKSLNLSNLDYNKSELQRKKFRHYLNYINLSKADSRNTNMILKIVNTKTQNSPR